MDARVKPAPHEIRLARAYNPKMRERDLASQLGVSEAELVAAYIGEGVVRLEPRVSDLLTGLEAVGEVMALTRNESAVQEKIGVYDKVVTGDQTAMALGENIDLRIFPNRWTFGFAVEKRDGDDVRRSLQFFDKAGAAVHKVHLRPSSNVEAYQQLVEKLRSEDQSAVLGIDATDVVEAPAEETTTTVEELRDRWSKLTDTHQFFGMLRTLKLGRQQALQMVGEDYAWRVENDALTTMLHKSVETQVAIMCFVGNDGCIQIHSGPIQNVKPMGPWINIFDETFHLHFRTDHVQELWVVRKPTSDGHVTSLEAYDAKGDLVIQFFGKRKEGHDERVEWREIAQNLPRATAAAA